MRHGIFSSFSEWATAIRKIKQNCRWAIENRKSDEKHTNDDDLTI